MQIRSANPGLPRLAVLAADGPEVQPTPASRASDAKSQKSTADSKAQPRYIVLTGNPNCGKTTLFNALTGLRAKVGNYAGVTVERKEGKLLGAPAELNARLLDLPGTYSLSPQSLDEQISRDVLLSRLPELPGSVGDELLKIHVSYGPLVQELLKKFNAASEGAIKGLAHITGGGFVDNIPRVLPRNCDVVIRKRSWEVLPIFKILQKGGNVPEAELYQVFNMGIGMILIVSKRKAEAILRFASAQKHRAWLIGEVVKGRGRVRVVS